MSWVELPTKLKVYVCSVAGLAIPIVIWATADVLAKPPAGSGWIVLTVLAIGTVPFFLFLPSFSATITIGDAYIMAIAMMYGVAPCVIATFLCISLISIFAPRPKIHIYRVVFNTASTTCCAFLYGSLYHFINRGSSRLQDILLPAVVVVVTYFLTNSMLTSIAIAWSHGESIIRFWIKSCIPLAGDYSMSAVSTILIVAPNSFGAYIPLAVAPFIGLAWGWIKINQNRIVEAERHLKEQEQLYLRTVESLALAVDAKDQTTYGHIRRVRVYAMGLAKLCGVKDPNELKAIETGSLLHDIGKLAIDDYILNKPGKLSKEEFEKIKVHAVAGDEILQHVHFPFPAARYVRYHHERWDGKGYPDGLKGEEIPIGARILAIADAFDAIRFSRPYKLAIPMEEARELLRAQAGIIYDPNLIKLFVHHMDELEREAVRESENLPEPSFRKYFDTANRALSAADISVTSQSQVLDVPAELILLSEFCSTIAGNLDLKDIFPIFAGRVKKMIQFSACAVYLNDGQNSLRATCASGLYSDLIQDNTVEIGKGISGWVFAYKKPMINTGPALDFQFIDNKLASFKDALVVPITHEEDEALGTISLYSEKPSTYTQHELNILQTLAGFLAPLIAESKKPGVSASEDVLDPTTGLHRIPYLTAIGPQLIALAGKNKSSASLIFIEIKSLSQIVRTYGANLGNSVLKKVADCIKPELRSTDILVRFGHHGFVAFLPGVRDEQALHCAQRLKYQIKNQSSNATGQNYAIDCQTGIASYPRDGITVLALLQSAQKNVGASAETVPSQDGNVIGFSPRT